MQIIADNLQITNPRIQTAVERNDPEPIQQIVQACITAGAQAIDINSGPLNKNGPEKMEFLVETVQAVTSLPLLLDTVNPQALEAGLRVSHNPAVINGFSLEPAKLKSILPLAVKYDVDIVGYLLYENGLVPADEAERFNLAIELFTQAHLAGLAPERLIIDPIVAPLIWENGLEQNRAMLNIIRNLPDLLDFPVRTIAGLSNLATGRGDRYKKRLLESAFLPMLAASGLSMALLNILHSRPVQIAQACHLLNHSTVFAYDELAEFKQ